MDGARYDRRWKFACTAKPRRSKLVLVPSACVVMMRRAIPAFAGLIVLSQPATAGVPLFGQVSCAVVRFYVAKYSEPAAEKWARSHGASEAEIETARHCLHPDVQTASLAQKSPAVAPVIENEGRRLKPHERDSDQGTAHASLQVQLAHVEQDSHGEQSARVDREVILPKDVEDRSSAHPSQESRDGLVPSDAKASTLRPRNPGGAHRAYSSRATSHGAWFKQLWARLTRRPHFTVAVLHFGAGRR